MIVLGGSCSDAGLIPSIDLRQILHYVVMKVILSYQLIHDCGHAEAIFRQIHSQNN